MPEPDGDDSDADEEEVDGGDQGAVGDGQHHWDLGALGDLGLPQDVEAAWAEAEAETSTACSLLFSITTRIKSTMGQTFPHRYWVALSRCGRTRRASAFLCTVVDMVVRRWFACSTCLRKLRFWNGSNMISMLEPSTRALICEHGLARGLDLFGSGIQAVARGLLVFCASTAGEFL